MHSIPDRNFQALGAKSSVPATGLVEEADRLLALIKAHPRFATREMVEALQPILAPYDVRIVATLCHNIINEVGTVVKEPASPARDEAVRRLRDTLDAITLAINQQNPQKHGALVALVPELSR